MINLQERHVAELGLEPANPESAVIHDTDYAMEPGWLKMAFYRKYVLDADFL